MSDYEFWNGELVEIHYTDYDEKLKEILILESNLEKNDILNLEHKDLLDTFEDNFYDDYLLYHDKIYKINGECSEMLDSFAKLDKQKNGYKFSSYFYNGGTCLSEMLTDELEKEN